jgi:hypothetical protein
MSASFRIAGTFELSSRGTVLFGDIVDGTIVPGMRVTLPDETSWPIAAIEYIDSIARREYHVALVLRDAPSVNALSAQLPLGTVVSAR